MDEPTIVPKGTESFVEVVASDSTPWVVLMPVTNKQKETNTPVYSTNPEFFSVVLTYQVSLLEDAIKKISTPTTQLLACIHLCSTADLY